MEKSEEFILNDKKERINRLKLSISDEYGNEIFTSKNQNISSNAANFLEKSPTKLDKNWLVQRVEARQKKAQKKCTNSSTKIEKTNFFRLFRNNIIFRIFFPSLLYAGDYENIPSDSLTYKLVSDASALNKLLKSCVGIVSAWLLTFLFYYYLRHSLRVEVTNAIPSVLIVFVTSLVGLSFNNPRFRCVILLILPFMATNRGRTIILMSCYQLSATSIVPNILKNLEVLQTSYGCHMQIMETQMSKLARQNNLFLRTQETLKSLQRYGEKAKRRLTDAKRLIKKVGVRFEFA